MLEGGTLRARAVPRHPPPGAGRRRAGPALGRVPPAVRDEPPLLRQLHRRERRHARRRVPLERHARARRDARASSSSSGSPYPNHNGGQLAFGPDGLLYVGMGDGGSGGDPENRAQNLARCSASCCAIDVDAARRAAGRSPRYGLRNPWRFSFDRATGDLYIGDVGQGSCEEIDFTPRCEPRPRELRLGRLRGQRAVRGQAPERRGPLVVADRTSTAAAEGCSVTGGFVYRGRGGPGAARPLLLRRLLQRHDLVPRAVAAARRRSLRREAITRRRALLVRRGRGAASSTPPRSPAGLPDHRHLVARA